MSPEAFVVAGTDTGVGKTVAAAALLLALDGRYWKPVQTGAGEGSDTDAVRRMTGLPAERFLPEVYRFRAPLSPHRAAELEGLPIDPERLAGLPAGERPLVVELAGGLLVPWTRDFLQIQALERWGAPVVLAARTTLGTINHSLLALETLRRREIRLAGLLFSGEENANNERTILEFSKAPPLGRLPRLERLDPASLRAAARGLDLRPLGLAYA